MVAVEPSLPERTARLVLRVLVAADLADHHRLFSNPTRSCATSTTPRSTSTPPRPTCRGGCASGRPGEGEWRNLAVECGGHFIGEVGVTLASRAHRQCEIGYVFDPRWHGHGYATQASAAMVDFAFAGLGAHRVVGRMDARNDASARVMERLGMRREAHLRENEYVKGEWTDEVIYAVLEDRVVPPASATRGCPGRSRRTSDCRPGRPARPRATRSRCRAGRAAWGPRRRPRAGAGRSTSSHTT